MHQELHSHSGGVVLVWHWSLIHFPYSFQQLHHPTTLTIKCLRSTTTTTTTRMVVQTTVMLCRCLPSCRLIPYLVMQVIIRNWHNLQPLLRLPVGTRIETWLRVSIKQPLAPVSSNLLLQAANPLLEPMLAPTTALCFRILQLIFAAVQLLLFRHLTGWGGAFLDQVGVDGSLQTWKKSQILDLHWKVVVFHCSYLGISSKMPKISRTMLVHPSVAVTSAFSWLQVETKLGEAETKLLLESHQTSL